MSVYRVGAFLWGFPIFFVTLCCGRVAIRVCRETRPGSGAAIVSGPDFGKCRKDVGKSETKNAPQVSERHFLVVSGRIELPTHGFSVHCSTI